MKQNYFIGLIACAALTMTGCSNDEINAPQQSQGNNAIEFSTYLGRNAQGSRGTETNDASIKSENGGFGVLAYYTEQKNFADANNNKPNFMWNQKVTYSNSAWSYTPVKYWPTKVGDKVSFFAYAPYAANGNDKGIVLSGNSATGAPTATITLPDDLSQTIDFVAAVQMNKSAANNNVRFTLKHEMTRVKVQAKLNKLVYDANDAKKKTFVVIKDVKFNNKLDFYKSGIYTFSIDDNTIGKWAPVTDDSKTTSLDLNKAMAKETIKVTDAKGESGSGNYQKGEAGIKLVNTDPVPLIKDDQYLFLIPVANLTDGQATATIEYDIVTEDSKLEVGYSCTNAIKTVKLPAGTLQQGKSYNYTFIINLDEIVLDATVEKWDETASGNDINVPYTPDDATVKTNPGA